MSNCFMPPDSKHLTKLLLPRCSTCNMLLSLLHQCDEHRRTDEQSQPLVSVHFATLIWSFAGAADGCNCIVKYIEQGM